MSNDTRCGKTLSHLFFKVFNEVYGSVPPTLGYIQTESHMVLFLNDIFVHNTGLRYKTRLKHVLAASVLIFYDAFIDIIENEPSGKYKNLSHHPFNQKMLPYFLN